MGKVLITRKDIKYSILGKHEVEIEEWCLLGCYAVWPL
jgi:hypothetical protein